MSSLNSGEFSDSSLALRLDSPGVTRLRGPGLTLHGQGQNRLASMSVYGLRATPGQYRLTQRGEVSLQRSSPDPHNRAHSDVRISVTSRTKSSSTSVGSTTSNLRPDADSTASTYSAPNLANRSLCSTTTVVTPGSRSKANSFLRRPFSADPTSVTTRSTRRLRPVAQVVARATCRSRPWRWSAEDTQAYTTVTPARGAVSWAMRISPPTRVAGTGSFPSRNQRYAVTGCTPCATAHSLKFTIT